MPRIGSPLLVYPIKGFPPVEREEVSVLEGGILEYDRRLALFDENGEYVNGRSHPDIFEIRTEFDLVTGTITVAEDSQSTGEEFELREGNHSLEKWFSNYFGEPLELVRAQTTNFTDSAGGIAYQKTAAAGPSLIGAETLRTVASWFEELDFSQMLARTRPNLILEDSPPFWEDRLWTDPDHLVRFRIGGKVFEGVAPLPRCSVPTRDPKTGVALKGFINTFVEKRRELLPEFVDSEYLQFGTHYKLSDQLQSRYEIPDYYFLGAVVRIPRSSWGETLQVGEEIEIEEEVELVRNL